MVFTSLTKIAIQKIDKESIDDSATSPKGIVSPRFQEYNPPLGDDIESPTHRMGAKLD